MRDPTGLRDLMKYNVEMDSAARADSKRLFMKSRWFGAARDQISLLVMECFLEEAEGRGE